MSDHNAAYAPYSIMRAFVLVGLLAVGCGGAASTQEAAPYDAPTYGYSAPPDGDTVHVEVDGGTLRTPYIEHDAGEVRVFWFDAGGDR